MKTTTTATSDECPKCSNIGAGPLCKAHRNEGQAPQVYVLRYRWLDLSDSAYGQELHETLESAEAAADKLVTDQQSFATFDSRSRGQLEITIARYTFEFTQDRRVL
jgi:hypothetical protein